MRYIKCSVLEVGAGAPSGLCEALGCAEQGFIVGCGFSRGQKQGVLEPHAAAVSALCPYLIGRAKERVDRYNRE